MTRALQPYTTVSWLEREGQLLGRMPLQGVKPFALHCGFEPTPSPQPYHPLFDQFDQDASLADRMVGDDFPELLAQAEAVLDQILALNLLVRRGAMLGLEGDHASFRPPTPQEEPQ